MDVGETSVRPIFEGEATPAFGTAMALILALAVPELAASVLDADFGAAEGAVTVPAGLGAASARRECNWALTEWLTLGWSR